jgi:hypothetical protein
LGRLLLQHFPDRSSFCRRLRRQKLGVLLPRRCSSRWLVPCGGLFRYAAGKGDQKDEGPGRLIGRQTPGPRCAAPMAGGWADPLCLACPGAVQCLGEGAWERCRSRPTGSITAVAVACWWRSALPVTTAIFTARVSVRGSADSSRCAGRQRATNTPGVEPSAMPRDSAIGGSIIRK